MFRFRGDGILLLVPASHPQVPSVASLFRVPVVSPCPFASHHPHVVRGASVWTTRWYLFTLLTPSSSTVKRWLPWNFHRCNVLSYHVESFFTTQRPLPTLPHVSISKSFLKGWQTDWKCTYHNVPLNSFSLTDPEGKNCQPLRTALCSFQSASPQPDHSTDEFSLL